MNALFDLIKSQAETLLNNEPSVSPSQNTQIFEEAQNTVVTGLKNMSPGELEMLSEETVNGTLGHHPKIQGISNSFAENISSKLGLDSTVAWNIASAIIPGILGKITGKGTGAGLNLESILGGLTGNGNNTPGQQNGGILDQLTGLGKQLGLDKDGDGDIDLDDLKKIF